MQLTIVIGSHLRMKITDEAAASRQGLAACDGQQRTDVKVIGRSMGGAIASGARTASNGWLRRGRRFLPVVVSLALLTLAYRETRDGRLSAAFEVLDPTDISACFLLLLISQVLAALRYRSVLRTFGHRSIGLATVRAVFMGMAASLALSVVGLAAARWSVLRREGLSLGTVVITTIYEKLLAFAVLVILGALAASSLFEPERLLRFALAAVAPIVAALVFGAGLVVLAYLFRRRLAVWLQTFSSLRFHHVFVDTMLTVIVHASVAAAYVVIMIPVSRDVPITALANATFIMMLVATIPISFAGWGLREVGALFAFGSVGIDPSQVFAVSVTFGTLTVLSMLLLAAIFTVGQVGGSASKGPEAAARGDRPTTAPLPPASSSSSDQRPPSGLRLAALVLPFMVALTVPFHVWVPVGEGFLNLNLADALVPVGGLLFLYMLWQTPLPQPRIVGGVLGLYLIGTTLVIALGLLLGYQRYGFTTWAFVNRGIGWIVVLGFFASGGLAALAGRKPVLPSLLPVILYVYAATAAVGLIPVVADTFNIALPIPVLAGWQAVGFAEDPNAFGYQLLLALAAAAALALSGQARRPIALALASLLILLAAFGTQSRTTYVVLVVLLVAALLLAAIARGLNRRFWLSTLAILAVTVGLGVVFYILVGYQAPILRPQSDSLHWRMIVEGIGLFLEKPLFGAGLGAHLVLNPSAAAPPGGFPLVLHSVWIWMLAELGLFGTLFFVMLLGGTGIVCLVFYKREARLDAALGALILVILAVYGLPHDIFYQRLFWFLLGAAVTSLLAHAVREHTFRPSRPAVRNELPSKVLHEL